MAFNLLFICITISLLVKGAYPVVVFVSNSSIGSDVTNCGNTAQRPCKSLQRAFSISKSSRVELFLDGGNNIEGFQYFLQYSVFVYEDILVRKLCSRVSSKECDKTPNPIINTDSSTIKFAFVIAKNSNLSINRIDFKSIGIAKIVIDGQVKLTNSIVSNVYHGAFKLLQGKARFLINSTTFHGVNNLLNNSEVVDVAIQLENSAIIGKYKTKHTEIALYMKLNNESSRLNLFVSNCTFKSLISAMTIVNVMDTSNMLIKITNSNFIHICGNKATWTTYSAVYIEGKSNVYIRNCVFTDNKSFNGGAITARNVTNLEIHECIFQNNTAINSGGACFFRGELGKVHISKTVFAYNSVQHDEFEEKGVDDRGGAINNKMDLFIEHTTFFGNQVHSFGGGINHEGSRHKKHLLKLLNVIIIGAEVSSLFGDLIHSTSFMEMENTTLITKSSTIDDVIFYQSNEATVTIKNNFYFSCPSNQLVHKKQNVLFSNNSVNVNGLVMYYCSTCERDTYNLSSSYEIKSINDTGIRNIICSPCPMGGLCDDGVVSSDNFWGWREDHEIVFNVCPPKRCCSRFGQECLSYNTCNFKREGILCGRCVGNYSENYSIWALFPGCVKCTETGIAIFWLAVLLSNFLYVIVAMYKDEFVEQVKSISFSKKEKIARILTAHQENRKKKRVYSLNKMKKGKHKRRGAIRKKKKKKKSEPSEKKEQKENRDDLRATRLKCLFKEILLFYQVDFALQVKSSERAFTNSDGTMHKFLSYLLGLTKDKSEVDLALCPLPLSDALTNEFVFLIIVFALIIIVVFLLIIIKISKMLILWFSQKVKTHCQPSVAKRRNFNNSDNLDEELKPLNVDRKTKSAFVPSFSLRLKCCIIELLLFYYISIATTAYTLEDCIKIAGKSRLYIEGNTSCPSRVLSWFLIIWVVALPLTMSAGAKMMRSREININTFLALGFILPPLFPVCFILKRYIKNQNSKAEINHILQVFSEEVHKNKEKNKIDQCNNASKEKRSDMKQRVMTLRKTLSLLFKGQTVLLLRKLIFAICQIKIHDPIIRMYVVLTVLILFLVAHYKVSPWEDKILNSIDFIILLLLCLLAAENLYWAFDYMSDMTFTQEFRSMGDTFLYLEFLLLIPILLILAIIMILVPLIILVLPFAVFGTIWLEKKHVVQKDKSFRLTTYV